MGFGKPKRLKLVPYTRFPSSCEAGIITGYVP
jgi:hypothetical protein